MVVREPEGAGLSVRPARAATHARIVQLLEHRIHGSRSSETLDRFSDPQGGLCGREVCGVDDLVRKLCNHVLAASA